MVDLALAIETQPLSLSVSTGWQMAMAHTPPISTSNSLQRYAKEVKFTNHPTGHTIHG